MKESGGLIFLECYPAPRGDINKPMSILENGSDLVLNTTPIKVMMSVSSQPGVGQSVVIQTDLANSVEIQKLKGIIKTAIQETIVQRMSSFYAVDAI